MERMGRLIAFICVISFGKNMGLNHLRLTLNGMGLQDGKLVEIF